MRQLWRDLRWTLLLTLIATGGGAALLAGCGPKPAVAAEGMGAVRAGTVSLNAPGDTAYVPLNWTMGSVNDGFGQATGFETSGRRQVPSPSLQTSWVAHPASVRNTVIPIPLGTRLTAGQTASGDACVKPTRMAYNQRGPETCDAWSFTMVVPPLPPVDSAWVGDSVVTTVALGLLWQDAERPALGEPLLAGGLMRTTAASGVVLHGGVCLGAVTAGGTIVLRPVTAGAGQTARQDCVAQRAKLWPGRTVVAYESATAAQKELAEPLRFVRFLAECGLVEVCRQVRAFGGDALGWRVDPALGADQLRLDAVVPLAAAEPEPPGGVSGFWLELAAR